METKRYIGNDTTRIFARVRRELGPDAVIVRTRSLLREGAEPLIEVLAAAPAGDPGISLDLQHALIEGALAHAEYDGRPLTVGDLEDLAARETAAPSPSPAFSREDPEPLAPPSWLEGYVHAPTSGPAPFLPPDAGPPPAPVEWSPRPRIITRESAPLAPAEVPGRLRSFAPVEPGAAGALVAAGFSAEAARTAAVSAPASVDPASALEAALAAHDAAYPGEGRTALITIQGPAGSGRTTALMRMALDCADAGRPALLVAADTSHTGGPAQVHAYAEAIGIPVFDAFSARELVDAVSAAPRGACIFVDVPPGRWTPPPLPGVEHFSYLALPAHWDAAALASQVSGLSAHGFAGAILTHTDLAAGLAPVLSMVIESGLGLAFLSSGRDVATGIEVADPLTLASGVFTTTSRETTNGRLVASA